jgi:glycosyltransferase involved in cell wall biosynthesis
MRVLYLNPNGTIGGAEASLLHLMAGLRAAEPGWALSLIAGADGPLLSRAEALGVSTRVVAFPRAIGRVGDAGASAAPAFFGALLSGGVRVPAYVARLRQAVREFNPGLVHSNGLKMHLLSAYAPELGTPLIWHVHDYVRSRPVVAPLLRLCAHRCSTAVTNSSSVAEDLRSVCAPGLRIEAVHNGIDTKAFAPDGPSLDLDGLAGLSPMDKRGLRVGLLGTFARWKGHETFLRALAMLDPSLSFRGYVIGGSIYQTDGSQHTVEELKKLAGSLGLGDRLGFTGYLDDPAAAIRSLDVVVHASTQPEPFGMVIVEAMACAKAVIVSRCGGASEIVEDRVNALTHEAGDAPALAARIQELALSSQLRARLGEAGRRTAEQRFTRARFANEMASIYRRLAGTWN